MKLHVSTLNLRMKSIFSKKKKTKKDSPLIAACREQPQSLEEIRALVAKSPASIKSKTHEEEVPLAVACQRGASLEVIQFLVETWHGALKVRDDKGILPLHWACFHGASLATVQYLTQQWPAALQVCSNWGCMPLHVAAAFNAAVVPCMIEDYREAVRDKNKSGFLALHLALQNKSNLIPNVVKVLLEEYLEGAAIRDDTPNGLIPLHFACRNGAPLELIESLVQAYPQGIQTTCLKDGALPLHMACTGSVPKQQQQPREGDKCEEAEDKGNSISLELIQYLVQQWPKSLQMTTHPDGHLPLHLALQHNAPLAVIQYLVESYPSSLHTKTASSGALPLHIAVSQKHASLQVVQYLAKAGGDVTLHAQTEFGQTPLDMASRTRNANVQAWLEKVAPGPALADETEACSDVPVFPGKPVDAKKGRTISDATTTASHTESSDNDDVSSASTTEVEDHPSRVAATYDLVVDV